jgi:uncharacterized protein (TIGR00369 family)
VCQDKSEPGRTTWTMSADERFANPSGIIQGGFLAALADSAMGASSVTWARSQDYKTLVTNTDLNISFLRAARVGTVLSCTAVVISGSRRAVFVEAHISDDAGRMVARASSTFLLVPRD